MLWALQSAIRVILLKKEERTTASRMQIVNKSSGYFSRFKERARVELARGATGVAMPTPSITPAFLGWIEGNEQSVMRARAGGIGKSTERFVVVSLPPKTLARARRHTCQDL